MADRHGSNGYLTRLVLIACVFTAACGPSPEPPSSSRATVPRKGVPIDVLRGGPLKIGAPTRTCAPHTSSGLGPNQIQELAQKGWQWVGGSVFDLMLPGSFKRSNAMGIDSEVAEWEAPGDTLIYEIGPYTAYMSGGRMRKDTIECLDGVPVRLIESRNDRTGEYLAALEVPEIGFSLQARTRSEADRKTIFTALRTIRFHEHGAERPTKK